MHFVCNQSWIFFTHILTMIIFGLCFFCDAKFSYFSKFQKTKIVLSLKVINKCYFAISRMVQYFIFVRSLSCVQLIVTPWTAARQASLSFTISWNLLKLMSTESVMPSNHLFLCYPFSSYHHSFPTSGSFPMSWLFPSSSQSVGSSASASVLPMNIQGWFLLGLTGLISLQPKGLSRVFFSHTSNTFCSAFFMVQLSHLYMTTGKIIALTISSLKRNKLLFPYVFIQGSP